MGKIREVAIIIFCIIIHTACYEEDNTKDRLVHIPYSENEEKDFKDFYLELLNFLNEPTFNSSNFNKGSITYRLLLFTLWADDYIIRIEKKREEIKLFKHVLANENKYKRMFVFNNGKKNYTLWVKDSDTIDITKAEWRKMEKLIRGAYFWTLNSNEDRVMFDGDGFIIEGFFNGKYHYVKRLSPYDGTFRKLCLYFIELADLDYPLNNNIIIKEPL